MDITMENQIEAMRKFAYFIFNWPDNFVSEIWGDNVFGAHMKSKLHDCGFDIARFFVELDKDNQHRMMQYILENYKG